MWCYSAMKGEGGNTEHVAVAQTGLVGIDLMISLTLNLQNGKAGA